MLGLAVAGAYLVFIAYAILSDPLGLKGSSGHFPNALQWATPQPWQGTTFVGYAEATAEALDRQDRGRNLDKRLRFVDAATPSTGNLVVSVNPIDRFTWAATAKASNGRCYALLTWLDSSDPQYGGQYYAKFPRGTPCEGRRATRETVRLEDAPD